MERIMRLSKLTPLTRHARVDGLVQWCLRESACNFSRLLQLTVTVQL